MALGSTRPLASLISNGLAYHHAGVPTHLLRLVEDLAGRRLIRAVAATTTAAEGADLPFKVVIIPHLNFGSSGRGRLDRGLYLNIVGRVGRANVALEGLVFVLGSIAPTLSRMVENELPGRLPRSQGRRVAIAWMAWRT